MCVLRFIMSNSRLKRSGMACINEGSHSFTCHLHVYPQVEWTALPLLSSHRASPHFGRYTFSIPVRVKAELVSVAGHKPRWSTHPQTVTHPSTNRAGRRVTLVIESNALPLSQAAAEDHHHAKFDFYPTTWVVSAKTRFATIRFIYLSFFFDHFVTPSCRNVLFCSFP